MLLSRSSATGCPVMMAPPAGGTRLGWLPVSDGLQSSASAVPTIGRMIAMRRLRIVFIGIVGIGRRSYQMRKAAARAAHAQALRDAARDPGSDAAVILAARIHRCCVCREQFMPDSRILLVKSVTGIIADAVELSGRRILDVGSGGGGLVRWIA